MNELTLTIAGERYGGWKEVSVHRSIEYVSGAFEVTAAETEPADPFARHLRPGQACTVALDGDIVITGWVDELTVSHDGASHDIFLAGRDATGDLVDCSAVKQEWKDAKLERIAAAVCAPFGIAVRAEADTGKPFPSMAVATGEPAFGFIEQLCRQRAVLAVSDGKGALVLIRTGAGRAAGTLAFGENILGASLVSSDRDRFSSYVVDGNADLLESWSATASTEPQGRAADPFVARYRPRIEPAGKLGDGVTFADQARWEAVVAAGRARRGRVTVQGWRDAAGALWAPNSLVAVLDPLTGIDADMLIAGVEYARSRDGGTRAVLDLARPEAFSLIELAADAEGDGFELWN